jgi:hypothetical protein
MSTALALAALTCWLCRPLVSPRSRLTVPDDLHRHLRTLGRQGRLTSLALLLTIATLVAVVGTPNGVNPDLRDLRWADASCGKQESPYDPPTCFALEPGGQWVMEEVRPDGTRMIIATVATPDFR